MQVVECFFADMLNFLANSAMRIYNLMIGKSSRIILVTLCTQKSIGRYVF